MDDEDAQMFPVDHGNISMPSSSYHDSAYSSLSADDRQAHCGVASNIEQFDPTISTFFPVDGPQDQPDQSAYLDLGAQQSSPISSERVFQRLGEPENSVVAGLPDSVLRPVRCLSFQVLAIC